MFIVGLVLRVERVQGMDSETGRTWDYLRAHILDGITVHRAKVADDFGPITAGEEVAAEVSIAPYTQGAAARYSVTLVRSVPALLDAAPSVVPHTSSDACLVGSGNHTGG